MATKVPTDAQWEGLIANIKAKANLADLANVATTGEYSDLKNTPVLSNVALTGEYSDLKNTPTIGNGVLTIQRNGVNIGTFDANATAAETINIAVPTTAADINALDANINYGAGLALSINSETYEISASLTDQAGNVLGTTQTIDLPLESVVVSGEYNATSKNVALTLQSGSKVEFSVADLVSGLQSEINADNKLDANYINLDNSHQFLNNAQVEKLDGMADIKSIGSNLTLNSETGELTATDTTYNVFGVGENGLVPASTASDANKYLAGDGSWKEMAEFSLNPATTTNLGGIKVGEGLNVEADGTLSVATFSASDWANLWA